MGKETSRCEWVNLRKLAVMHDFWTCDLNPSLGDSNPCHIGSIFSTFWNSDSNHYLGDSNHPSHLTFFNFLEKRFCQLLSIHFLHSKLTLNDPKVITLEAFWTLSLLLSEINEVRKCLKHGQKCISLSECRS